MSGSVPVGRRENRFSVPPQDFHQVAVHHEGVADANGGLREGNLDPADEFYVRNQQIVDQRNPDLCFGGVFAGPEEALDLEILLDPLEKQIDLPTAPIFSFAARISDILPLLKATKHGMSPERSSSVWSLIAPLCFRQYAQSY